MQSCSIHLCASCCVFDVCFLCSQGPVLGGGSGCQHYLQQDSWAGSSAEGHLPEPPRRHYCCGRRRPNGHQWVSIPVPIRTLELLGARGEDCLWPGAASRSVWVLVQKLNGPLLDASLSKQFQNLFLFWCFFFLFSRQFLSVRAILWFILQIFNDI